MNKKFTKWRKEFLNLNIKRKILYSNIVIIFLILIVLGISVYFFSNRQIVQFFTNSSSQLMSQLCLNMNNQIQNFSEFVSTQYINSDMSAVLVYDVDRDSSKARYGREKSVRRFAYNLLSYKSDIETVMVEDVYGELYYNSNQGSSYADTGRSGVQIPFEDAIKNRGKMIWHSDGELIYASKVLYHKETTQIIGVLTIGLRKNFLEDIYENITEKNINKIVVLNQDARILAASDDEGYGFAENVVNREGFGNQSDREIYYKSQKHIYSVQKTPGNNLYIMHIINLKNLTAGSKRLFFPFLYAMILAVLLASLLSGALSEIISGNIKLLLQKIKSLAKGDFSNRIESESKDEIGALAVEFNNMSDKIQTLLEDVVEERLKNKNAEIKALQFEYDSLQAKINPHFLYNTLESINSMAKLSGDEETASAILLLGNYLRETVSSKNKYITLQEELQNVYAYVRLQQMIFGERLKYDVKADEILMEAMVPRLILQPLVENSIVHGIAPKTGIGEVLVRTFCEGQYMVIMVEDDGVGISGTCLEGGIHKLEEMDREVPEQENGHVHVGLLSVHKRIQILYGDSYGIYIDSRGMNGTGIKVKLPINFNE